MIKLPQMPSLSEIPGKVQNYAGSLAQDAWNSTQNSLFGDESETPNYIRFMRVVENQDLARSNMFLVRFVDFRSIIKNDGILDFSSPVSSGDGTATNSSPFSGTSYTWNRVQDLVTTNAMKVMSPKIKQIMGAVDPSLVRMIPGAGELLDTFLGSGYNVNKDLALMVKSVNIPGSTLETTLNKTDRMPFHEVKGRTFSNITITFYCTPGYEERVLMLNWQNAVHDNKRGRFGFYHSYAKDINILTLDRKGTRQSIVVCEGCYPIRVGDVQLDYEQNSQIATVEVEFAVAHANHITAEGTQSVIDAAESILRRGQGTVKAFKN